MNLLVGLGNPGIKYENTRHNIGFMVIGKLLKDLVPVTKDWEVSQSFKAHIFKHGDLVFAKPQTFMNASGVSVKKLMDFYKVPAENIWVIHDDIDLPLGKIRIRVGGGTAGHHGVESIIRETGVDGFVRFRLGVGRDDAYKDIKQNVPTHRIEKYVVSPFTTHEEGDLRKLIKHSAHALELALQDGLDKAMNQFN